MNADGKQTKGLNTKIIINQVNVIQFNSLLFMCEVKSYKPITDIVIIIIIITTIINLNYLSRQNCIQVS
jgi:hypothetical protein